MSDESAAKRHRVASPLFTPLLLDGGCGLELKRRKSDGQNVAYNLTLFSTAALMDTPDAIRQLHQDYIRAGCNVITTASYAVNKFYLDKVEQSHRVRELAARSVSLAREAIAAESAEDVMVAASVPPLGESYQDTGLSEEETNSQYDELLPGLKAADLFLCETFASIADASMTTAAVRRMCPTGRLWISFTPRRKGETICLSDGASVADMIGLANNVKAEALLFNCAPPEIIGLALSKASEVLSTAGGLSKLRIGGYGNFWEELVDLDNWSISKQETDSGKGDQQTGGMKVRDDLTATSYTKLVAPWLDLGASVVGGCCGIGPDHIAAVGRDLCIGRRAKLACDQSDC
eukprot:TRINITY_DN104106_c0_g1_i1.p1 TRINITY_DN104106_c0_g1~~TRINITY_DN104106_c0_g1_i1.p1  ORF type:complete len:366 (-),score=63.79 TRINITY_DN104106_c0_g1_i1:20-1063(-)